MLVVLLSIVIMLVLVAGMAIGVILGRKPIKGSCGGMSSLGMDTACDICGGDTKKCEEEQSRSLEGVESSEPSNQGVVADEKGLAYELKQASREDKP